MLDLFEFCTDDLKKQLEQKRKQIADEEEVREEWPLSVDADTVQEKMKKQAEEIKSGQMDKEKEKQRKKEEAEVPR